MGHSDCYHTSRILEWVSKKKNNYFFYKTPSCHIGGSGR